MEPQTTQPTSPTSAPSPQYNFSPTTVALTKAIGKAESGGDYNAPDKTGDHAGSMGAYQMTPSFLQNWAPKAGVQYQPGMKLNPQQQDEIASTAVQSMLGKGLIPAQVVSEWNTGDPNAYLDSSYGENNTYGSTQNEVNKVSQYYQEYTSRSNQGNTPAMAPSGGSSNGTAAALGVGAGALGLGVLGTIATDGTDLLGGALGDIGGWIQDALGITGLKDAITNETNGGSSGNGSSTPPPPSGTTTPPPQGGAQPNEPTPQTKEEQINQSEQESSTQLASALANAAKGIQQILQGTQGGRLMGQNPDMKSSIGTLLGFNLYGQDENGNGVINKEGRKKALSEVANLDDNLISTVGGAASPVSVSSNAATELGKNKLMSSTDRKATAKIANDLLNDDLNGIPMDGQMDIIRMREMEKQHNAAADQAYKEGNYTPTPKSMAHKILARGYANTIDKALEKDPHAQELHRRAKKMEKHLIESRKLDKYLNGKKIPKNNGLWESFLRQGARAAEIYIGDKLGGPVGAIIGGVIGEGLNRKITSHFGRNILSTPAMRAAFKTLKDTKPKEYTELVKALRKRGAQVPEEPKKPTTKSGLVKTVFNAEKKFEGKKGLVKP